MIKLHKVTIFVVESDGLDGNPLDQLNGDCYHNSGAHIVSIQTNEFDREWDEGDILNKTDTFQNRALLEALVTGQPGDCPTCHHVSNGPRCDSCGYEFVEEDLVKEPGN